MRNVFFLFFSLISLKKNGMCCRNNERRTRKLVRMSQATDIKEGERKQQGNTSEQQTKKQHQK